MADNKATMASGEEAKKADPVADTTAEAHSDDKKTEDAPADSDSTSQPRKTTHLPTHYKGMPRQWEKNRGANP
ncbi:hypothetical protein F4821DRAFT_245660 [Hypoxylon rubiginosum]|uniref:Uncharacterized protein n=1 Tax=Hypoxylon rubiginosum TaxID=110542 RepID=A0ACC0CRQ1_9PEZI|nr:hypothetical protein F4821DRAFT_245660 [Hypoxylon rubiginosum]